MDGKDQRVDANVNIANPVSDVAQAVTSVVDLAHDILERADRDGPDKEFNENLTNIQNSFADNDLDNQYRVMYKLFTDAGYPPTPGGNVGEQERSFRHTSLILAARLVYERKLALKVIHKLVK